MSEQGTAVLLAGFGAPDKLSDVPEFLKRVTQGRDVPKERIDEVATHYMELGFSPYNKSVRRLAKALVEVFHGRGLELPVYVGMRSWNPYLNKTFRKMMVEGVRKAAVITLTPFHSPASTDRYDKAIVEACRLLGNGAPEIVAVDHWHDNTGHVQAIVENIGDACSAAEIKDPRRVRWLFTNHSLPLSMVDGTPYVAEYYQTVLRVTGELGIEDPVLAYQSRSGRRSEKWLEPDIRDAIKEAAAKGYDTAIVVPVGFVADNVEVLYDLDMEAKRVADAAGMTMVRPRLVAEHPRFVSMLADLAASALAPEQRRTET